MGKVKRYKQQHWKIYCMCCVFIVVFTCPYITKYAVIFMIFGVETSTYPTVCDSIICTIIHVSKECTGIEGQKKRKCIVVFMIFGVKKYPKVLIMILKCLIGLETV